MTQVTYQIQICWDNEINNQEEIEELLNKLLDVFEHTPYLCSNLIEVPMKVGETSDE